MLITRQTAPTFSAIDPATLAEWLRIDPSTDTATVDLLLAAATDVIAGLTDRVLLAGDYTIGRDGPCYTLPIPLAPLNSITAVTAVAADGTETALALGTDYLAYLNSTTPYLSILNLPLGTASVTVACNAGYTAIDQIPRGLAYACAVLVAAGFDSRSSLDPQTMSTVTALVSKYRRTFVA